MRFLADESCDMAVVRALRAAEHDVDLVRDRGIGLQDESVARIAQVEQRILLTEDKDFGQLVGAAAANAVAALGDRLKTGFVVVEPGRFRITELKP